MGDDEPRIPRCGERATTMTFHGALFALVGDPRVESTGLDAASWSSLGPRRATLV
jgi:hypothetical protein